MANSDQDEFIPQIGDYCLVKENCGHGFKHARVLSAATLNGERLVAGIEPNSSAVGFRLCHCLVNESDLMEQKLTSEGREENNRLVRALIIQERRNFATRMFNAQLEADLASI